MTFCWLLFFFLRTLRSCKVGIVFAWNILNGCASFRCRLQPLLDAFVLCKYMNTYVCCFPAVPWICCRSKGRERNMSERKSHSLEQIHSTLFYEDKTKMPMCHKQHTHRQLLRLFADFLFLAWLLHHKNLARALQLSRDSIKTHLQNHIKIERKCDFVCLYRYCLTTNPSHLFFNMDKTQTIGWQLVISCVLLKSISCANFLSTFIFTFHPLKLFNPFWCHAASIDSVKWNEELMFFITGSSNELFQNKPVTASAKRRIYGRK